MESTDLTKCISCYPGSRLAIITNISVEQLARAVEMDEAQKD